MKRQNFLLIHTESTLLTICGVCGFSDLRYLNSSFQRFYGVSPKTFRKQNQNCPNQGNTLKQDVTNKQYIFSKTQSLEKITQLFTSPSQQ
ncbi:helix-turn-helix domain-containing protein [Listeria cornellensis]|uniref:helix-turn-helix domain-containing protein n=1 Tax=Listeria cornellensis TaxID=1494961 RepID=UPI003B98665A